MTTKTVVVKKCLISALKDSLKDDAKQFFLDYVDQCTTLISHMLRRSSILLNFYVTKCMCIGTNVVDFDEVKDAFWKQLLRGRLDELGSEPFPDDGINAAFDELQDSLGTSTSLWGVNDIPLYFDRTLGHAGILLKTAVLNNLSVPLLSKMQRLCKAKAATIEGVSGFDLLKAVRSGATDFEWIKEATEFVKAARNVLGLAEGSTWYDDTTFKSTVLLNTSWWMQTQFSSLGRRKNIIIPVFDVSRAHVRFDATHMYLLSWMCMAPSHPHPPPQRKQYMSDKEFDDALKTHKQLMACPVKKNFSTVTEYDAALSAYKTRKEDISNYKAAMDAHKKLNPSLGETKKDKPPVPKDVVNQKFPHPDPNFITKRPANMTPAQWKEERDRHAALMAPYHKQVAEYKQSDEFKQLEKEYDEYTQRVTLGAGKLFKPFKDKSASSGWSPSGSIMTDGVSLCVCYEKQIPRVTKQRTVDDDEKAQPFDDYDPSDPTIVGNHLVVGVDGGRVKIATVACVDNDRKQHTWSLSRAQYYSHSGIWRETRKKQAEYQPLIDKLGTRPENAVLRAVNHAEIKNYIEWSASVEDVWWPLALARRQSRRKMRLYSQKRSVLSSFWHTVHTELKAIDDHQPIHIAYGSAVKTMKSTGRGEIAAPTTEVFASCKREFGPENVVLEWEHNTTKVSWDTKKPKEAVYKKVVCLGENLFAETLCHTRQRYMPLVPEAEQEHMRLYKEAASRKAKRRRGGTMPWKHSLMSQDKEEKMCYVECRGLRFCPETRKYYDRDASSARAIAGLRCLTLRGLGRPTMFCPIPK